MVNFIGCFCSAKITDIDIVTDATASSPPESSAVDAPMSSVSPSPAESVPSVSQVTSSPAEMKLVKQGGGSALFSISERLPALTAPCKEELCGSAPLTVTGGKNQLHTHTHTHTQSFYCSSGKCPGLPG